MIAFSQSVMNRVIYFWFFLKVFVLYILGIASNYYQVLKNGIKKIHRVSGKALMSHSIEMRWLLLSCLFFVDEVCLFTS